MANLVMFFGIGVICLVAAGVFFRGKTLSGGMLALVLGVLAFIVFGNVCHRDMPSGLPAAIPDGTYEVRMVDFYYGNKTEKDSFVLALVLKEEGKSGKNPPEYVKIPIDYFADTGDLKKGKEMTIEIRLYKAAKKAVIKK